MVCSMSSCPQTSSNGCSKIILYGVGLVGVGAGLGYFIGKWLNSKTIINEKIKKNTDKVVDVIDIEDLGNKKVFCRCWKSEAFPYCDGTHAKHNKLNGDNVGPLIICKQQKEESQ
uniref:ZnF_CDGSH domain-containing protein n=1 Tax=Rhabditophanes sp. KR3021 TaxID=114890 RepID=A0AC35UFS4_9BILA